MNWRICGAFKRVGTDTRARVRESFEEEEEEEEGCL